MTRVYALYLAALDADRATFQNDGVVRVSIPAAEWRKDGAPVIVKVTVETTP